MKIDIINVFEVRAHVHERSLTALEMSRSNMRNWVNAVPPVLSGVGASLMLYWRYRSMEDGQVAAPTQNNEPVSSDIPLDELGEEAAVQQHFHEQKNVPSDNGTEEPGAEPDPELDTSSVASGLPRQRALHKNGKMD